MDVNKGMYGNVSLPPQLFSYYLSVSDAKLEVNALNPFPFNNRTANVVFARVENSNGCFDVAKVNLAVSATEPVDQVILESCDMDETNDGYYTFDLNQATSRILAQLPPQNLRVQYYRSLDEAILEQNEITNSFYKNETPFFQGLFIRVESEDNGDCISLGEFVELYVFELPEFYVPLEVIYCQEMDPVELAVFNPQGDYTYEWKDPSGTVISNQPSVLVESSGTYTVTAVSDLNCVSKIREISVRESSVAQIEQEDISIVDGGQQNSISIDTDQLGMGEYEYALDNPIGPYQQEPFFANVLPGIHTLYIRDQLGCGTTEIKVSVIGYPKFFTPNGDGQNDTWQVEGVSFQPGSIIYIYDKFGKLLAELDGTSEGWNGIYNGKQMPSSDYWYRVQLEDGRIQTGHFSLIGR